MVLTDHPGETSSNFTVFLRLSVHTKLAFGNLLGGALLPLAYSTVVGGREALLLG